jgi:hypothetical protein
VGRLEAVGQVDPAFGSHLELSRKVDLGPMLSFCQHFRQKGVTG